MPSCMSCENFSMQRLLLGASSLVRASDWIEGDVVLIII